MKADDKYFVEQISVFKKENQKVFSHCGLLKSKNGENMAY